jgi:hypothetical protein
MAETLITTPFPTNDQVVRMMGISRTRQRELEALVDEIVSGKRKANGTSAKRKPRVKSAKRKRA